MAVTRPGARLLGWTAVALALLWACIVPARAQELIVDLSQHLVAITTGFTGADVLLFGAAGAGEDVLVVVRGPNARTAVRRKQRVAGIWINNERMVFPRAPVFFHVAASGNLAGRSITDVLGTYDIGHEITGMQPRSSDAASPRIAEFRDALIRNKQRAELYAAEAWPVTFVGKRLFRTTIPFPANVPTGTYQVEVYSLHDGRIVEVAATPLVVSKIGIGAALYDFAHSYGAAYGLVAIATAVLAGWAAGTVFRRS